MRNIIFLGICILLASCQNNTETSKATPSPAKAIPAATKNFDSDNKLSKYWYEGKAEVSRYELQQNRYRDVHPGEAILIFVTEDFLTDKQVKNDNYSNPNSIPILKANMIRKFPTGLYDYSMMTSVFTPVGNSDYPNTLKVTTSSQEWCGHTYMQLNLGSNNYDVTLHSYFENEADQDIEVPVKILEDELFNRIRINPDNLPTGKMELLPSTVVARLMHLKYQPYEAVLSLAPYSGSEFEGEALQVYTIEYPELNRTLEIVFEQTAPYEIAGWKDSYPSAFDRQVRSTIAKKTHQIKNAYWSKNSLEDMEVRAELGL